MSKSNKLGIRDSASEQSVTSMSMLDDEVSPIGPRETSR